MENLEGKAYTPFMKQVTEDTEIITYRQLKRNIEDGEKWMETSIIIQSILGLCC